MKKVAPGIDFADSSYRNCETQERDLIVYVNSWDARTIKILFKNVLCFLYRGGSVIENLYEITENTQFLTDAVQSYYIEVPNPCPYKHFVVIDIDDCQFFEVVAESASVSKDYSIVP